MVARRARSFAVVAAQMAQPLLEISVPFRAPKIINCVVCVLFSKEEIEESAKPFQYALVLKFLRQSPSLDVIRSFIKSKWGLNSQPIVSGMKKTRNVFMRITNEDDFKKAMQERFSMWIEISIGFFTRALNTERKLIRRSFQGG